jgi:glycosyltransferase involved in cell wall biosynthesis|tara:strand:- start:894 stop:2021 length:1128 start_codon:yes stop_codon:yes gene_type:complete
MKIAIVVNSAWAAYNFRMNLARNIFNEGNDVIFIIPFDNLYSEKIKEDFKCYNLDIHPKSLNPFKELKTLLNLLVIYRKLKPDLTCHFTIKLNIYGSIASWFCRIPNIANITGLGSAFLSGGIYKFIALFLYKFSLSFSSKVFIQNTEDLNFFIENNITKKSKLELVPGSGVDLTKFKFNPTKRNHNFIFLMISRIIKDKGIYEYIEAIKIIKKSKIYNSVEFQLLGEVNSDNNSSINKAELNQWIDEGWINYLGVSDQVENIIAECDCVLLPSYREGMPRSVLEAFAIGRPAIVSDVPGCREIVDDAKNGLICQVKSSVDLAKKMVSIMELSDEDRFKYGENGRKKVESNFDEKIVINAYLKSINNILNYEKNI